MTHRIRYSNPHPITEVIGATRFNGVTFDLKRGLLATLDAARQRLADMDHPGGLPLPYERWALAAVQVAWYEELQHRVPASCQRTLAMAKEAAR